MSSSSIQAGGAVAQAFANVVDTALNLGNLTLNVVEAPTTLQISQSCMEAKTVELRTIKRSVKHKFRLYWFPRKEFDRWSSAVKAIKLKVGELTTEFSNLEETSHINFPFRLALIKEIDAECTKIDQAIREGKELEDALDKREIRRIVQLATPQIKIENILELNTKLEELLDNVKDQSCNTIRVQGTAGTGKRVLIQHVNNHVDIANAKFGIVLWVPASEYDNHAKGYSVEAGIQLTVATRLGLRIEGIKDVDIIASKIRAELDGAKYLLLLDDVKEDSIDLNTIGIPFPDNINGSKIIFTTNLPHVRPFGKFFNIKTGKLSEEDSWQMFEDILIPHNDTIRQDAEIGTIALKVVKWCDGLFSLIQIVAEIFKSKRDPETWSNGLQMLRRPAKGRQIYMQALKNFFHFSYEDLEKNQKLCFLFTLLYPKDKKIPVDCLLDCWAAHKLLECEGSESSDASGHDILECLYRKALLNEGPNKQYVTIDRVFRDAAMTILQKHDMFKCLVEQEALIKLQNNHCEDTHWISLANSDIDVLPTEVHCPKLTTLFLQKNSKLKTISSLFFEHMKELLVLDLYKTEFKSVLPMSRLQTLKVLYVSGCDMTKELPFKIDQHHDLEVLDIRGYIIYEIPHDVKRMNNLRRLMISIKPDAALSLMISELSLLKELIIDVKSGIVHKDEDSYTSWCNDVIGDIIEKIDTLKDLTMLKFFFKDDIVDVIQVRGDTLKIFVQKQGSLRHVFKERSLDDSSPLQVYIGLRMSSKLEMPRCFYSYDNFVLSCDKLVIDPLMEKVLVKVKALIVMKENSMEHLNQIGEMTYIHGCMVQRCNKIETLMQIDAFWNLKTLALSECPYLRVLFSKNVLRHFTSLKHLEIRDCSALAEINMLATSGGDILPTLTTLVLHNLKILTKICSDMTWPSLSSLQIHKCPKLTELPLDGNSASNMRTIKTEKMWWGSLQLDHDIKQKFERYCIFSD